MNTRRSFMKQVLGGIGCLLGIADFLMGKRYSQWTPIKTTEK